MIDKNANVTTTVNEASRDEMINGETWKFEAVAKTDPEGRTVTSFQKRNTTTGDVKDVKNTFKPETPYDAGNEVIIGEIDGVLYIQSNTSLSDALVVE